MRFHGVLQELMESKSQVAVLLTLLRYPAKIFTGREIAKLAGVSKTRTAEILSVLEANNVVNKKTIGATNEWSVNQESVLFGYLSKHFLRLDGYVFESLKNDIKKCFSDVDGITGVILYGSVARGDETNNSDLDLLILSKKEIRKQVLKKIDELNLIVVVKYGNPVSACVYTEKEFSKEGFAVELKKRIREQGIVLIKR